MNLEKMKRYICLALAVCLLFALAGCKAKVDPEKVQAIQDAQAALQAEQNGETAEEMNRRIRESVLHLGPIPR